MISYFVYEINRGVRRNLDSLSFAWEQRKLTEFVEFFSGLTYTPNDVQKNGTLVLRSSNVSNGEVVNADINVTRYKASKKITPIIAKTLCPFVYEL